MTCLKRDIIITLIIKFFLLMLLWFVCIKPATHKSIDTQGWMLKARAYNDPSIAEQSS
ncbi:cytochrome oxidase putative small subunit CydP [Legionella yabuuchiae]|uniref:cytochrome oxidase putative small subunit CydP n=1 Tax=Legionella yabuuchiae TaxID=376727 RepID=UPI003BF877D0